MKYITLPVAEKAASIQGIAAQEGLRRLPFFLAMEEYAARHVDEPDCFFTWQVGPTVIFGRNQSVESEVNTAYCRSHGIEMYRRKSGGGCVYADRGNIMLSYISDGEDVGLAYQRFVGFLLLVLQRLGVDAVGTSRNDVLIGNRKVSGTACYHLAGRTIVHSTLLYDTCMEHMLNAITPDPAKMKEKGIHSVRQRITLLKDYISMGIDEVIATIRTTLCRGERALTAADVAAIEALEQDYLREDFINHII